MKGICQMSQLKVLVTQSCPNFVTPRLLCPWNSPSKNTGVGRHFLLQGIFPTQGSNSGLLHCRRFFTTWASREAVNSQMWNNLSMKLNSLLDYNSKNKISISESIVISINEGEWTNCPCRRTPNNMCRYSVLENVKLNSPLLKCGLCIGTSLHRLQRGTGKQRVTTVEEPEKCYLSKIRVRVMLIVCKSDMM